MLPAIDDGAPSLDVSLEMARMAVADGITVTACTPHIYPGLYENTVPGIRAALAALRQAVGEAGIPLQLVMGADVHLVPDLVDALRTQRVPTLHGSRYFLFEPPHHVAPPRLEQMAFDVMAAGYVPVVTHPERLSWINSHYPMFARMVRAGAWLQITAGAVTGRFGPPAKYWAERLLDDGLVHILATDSHHSRKRPPLLNEAREAAARRVGAEEATHMVLTRPRGILVDAAPDALPLVPALRAAPVHAPRMGWWRRAWRKVS